MAGMDGVFRSTQGGGDPHQDPVFPSRLGSIQSRGGHARRDRGLGPSGARKTDQDFREAHDRTMRVLYEEIGLRLPRQ